MGHEPKTQHEPSSAPSGGASETAVKLKWVFFASLAVLALVNVFVLPSHPHFGLERVPGFWALFGLAGTVILARIAKWAAHTFLGKDEDYYLKRD